MKRCKLPDGSLVPAMGLGTWFLGEKSATAKEELAALRTGIEGGATLIDTAEMYGSGRSEQLIGKAIAPYDREKLFLISKVYPFNAGKNKIFKACEQSLERLGTEYLDLYLLHWRGSVPLAETVECMEKLVAQGKIRRWGVSNLDLYDMQELLSVPNGKHCQVNEVLYHLGSRGIDYDLWPWQRKRNIPVVAYCPLLQGGSLKRSVMGNATVKQLAKERGISVVQLLLAFVLSQEQVIAIPRSGNPIHVQENLAAAELVLTEAELSALNAAFPPPNRAVPLDIV